jgi:hypothetical protein
MHKSAIEDFFDHVLQRQTAQGPERAFRFKAIKASDGSVSPTHYPGDLNNPPPSRRISKRSGRRNADADAESIIGTSPHADAVADADADAESQSQSRGRKRAKGKAKRKQPRRQSTAEQAPNSAPPDPLQITDTAQSNYMQVNQTTMDILCTAGVTRPQPINGPGDGAPEYHIPRNIYDRYITPMSPSNENVNNATCAIDPSLLYDNNTTSSEKRSQRPKPRPLSGPTRTEDPIARARARALAALGLSTGGVWQSINDPTAADPSAADPSAAELFTANDTAADPTAADPTAPEHTARNPPATVPAAPDPTAADPTAADPTAADPTAADPTAADPTIADFDADPTVQNSFQQMTPPSSQINLQEQTSARRARITADDLAQQEAVSTQVVGRRKRVKKVNFVL